MVASELGVELTPPARRRYPSTLPAVSARVRLGHDHQRHRLRPRKGRGRGNPCKIRNNKPAHKINPPREEFRSGISEEDIKWQLSQAWTREAVKAKHISDVSFRGQRPASSSEEPPAATPPARSGLRSAEGHRRKRAFESVSLSSGCVGICQYEPVFEVYGCDGSAPPMSIWTPKRPPKFSKNIVGGNAVSRIHRSGSENSDAASLENRVLQVPETDSAAQLRRNRSGKIEEYIARDGYKAIFKALTEMKPEDVIR